MTIALDDCIIFSPYLISGNTPGSQAIGSKINIYLEAGYGVPLRNRLNTGIIEEVLSKRKLFEI
ncbi:hypothetical protein Ccrd_004068 [Cynara cardunculus var. scolymus]|uniref:Uncharacterized protein n=1 Tax=Cynara cardunculus var. scolymus TaxID=59895 RepID=A0A103XN84_CYNCS|nr:hypothetical protein Ccrd_004068 [Cynara cardunculus var. scolymus]